MKKKYLNSRLAYMPQSKFDYSVFLPLCSRKTKQWNKNAKETREYIENYYNILYSDKTDKQDNFATFYSQF